MKNYAAGILLLSWYKGRLYALLGKDHYNTYSDFGGKADDVDFNDPVSTASREMYEETCGCVIEKSIARCKLRFGSPIHGLSYTNKPYLMFLLFIPFSSTYIDNYTKVYKYIRTISSMSDFTEKVSLSWIPMNDVLHEKVKLRNVFQKTIFSHKREILEYAYLKKSVNTTYIYG